MFGRNYFTKIWDILRNCKITTTSEGICTFSVTYASYNRYLQIRVYLFLYVFLKPSLKSFGQNCWHKTFEFFETEAFETWILPKILPFGRPLLRLPHCFSNESSRQIEKRLSGFIETFKKGFERLNLQQAQHVYCKLLVRSLHQVNCREVSSSACVLAQRQAISGHTPLGFGPC